MLSLTGEDNGFQEGGQQQEEEQRPIPNRPQTVSSLSSIDSTGYEHNDSVFDANCIQQSASALPPLPSLMEHSGSSTVVTATTAATNANATFGFPTNSTFESSPNPVAPPSMQISSSTGVLVASTPNTNTVPEFLYQLTKMLTDNNRDIIEWSNGKIEVHSPHKLETHVLNRYFRHSKFASFQRQLNYFGFRKLAGKGKMAPCSYVNDATTDELGSLLLIKRKQGNETKSKTGGKKRDRSGNEGKSRSSASSKTAGDPVNPVLAGILYRSSGDNSTGSTNNSSSSLQQSQKAIARVAVGKGVRHGFVPQRTKDRQKTADSSLGGLSNQNVSGNPSPVQASLNALTQNFNQSMHETIDSIADGEVNLPAVASQQEINQYPLPAPISTTGRVAYVPGSLHRDDSLVDLAMIPIVGDGTTTESDVAASSGFSFVDFPFDSNIFSDEDPNI